VEGTIALVLILLMYYLWFYGTRDTFLNVGGSRKILGYCATGLYAGE